MHARASLIPAAAAAVLLAAPGQAEAGPLNPPPGPVSATHKTLTEIEPRIAINAANTPGDAFSLFRITEPGSYYFTGNITGVPSKTAIEIAADNVTLDLMGFTLQGVARSFDGVRAVNKAGLCVRNGVVTGFDGSGVDLGVGKGALVERIRASLNGEDGIHAGVGAVVRHCTARANLGFGIRAASGLAVVDSCTAQDNGSIGIECGTGSAISACSAVGNGDTGIRTSSASTITGCTALSNTSRGIFALEDSTIHGCTANSHPDVGILAGPGSTITHCTAAHNDVGVSVGNGGSVHDCAVRLNLSDGIRVSQDCIVRGNTCRENGVDGLGGGAGILATGSNRIEANHCVRNGTGIRAFGSNNLIIGNTAGGNTLNYDIAQNNRHGPIIDNTAPATPAVNGNSAPGTAGSADPWANFAH